MGLTWIPIRRNVGMVPVYDTPLGNVCDLDRSRSGYCVLLPDVREWLEIRGLDSNDDHSNYFAWWDDWERGEALFFFALPAHAVEFKITWS